MQQIDWPKAIDLEQAVLGAIILEGNALELVIDNLKADAFYESKHKAIYEAIEHLYEKRKPVDMLTVMNRLKEEKKLESIGGPVYLAELTSMMASSANLEYHATVIQQKAVARKAIETGLAMAKAFQSPDIDVFQELSVAEAKLSELQTPFVGKESVPLKEPLLEYVKKVQRMVDKQELPMGVLSGIEDLDALTYGWQPSDLIIIAARPSTGKTALMLKLALFAAQAQNAPVLINTIEMSDISLASRVATQVSRIDNDKMRKGELTPSEFSVLTLALSDVYGLPVYIDDTSDLTIEKFRSKARKAVREKGCKLIIIDYLQLMHSEKKQFSREQEVSYISRKLKQTAKELNVPVIALAQLNRAVENRATKRPQLSDLRESGSIEQDADVIMFLNNPEKNGVQFFDDNTPTKGVIEIILAKQRNGAVGDVRIRFIREQMRFESMSHRPETSWANHSESNYASPFYPDDSTPF